MRLTQPAYPPRRCPPLVPAQQLPLGPSWLGGFEIPPRGYFCFDEGVATETIQNAEPWVWVAVAVGVLIAVAVIAALSKAKKKDWDHARAEKMRNQVEQDMPALRQREAAALDSEAEAQRARANADRLEAQAHERRDEVEDQRSELNERLRAADERDPFVDTTIDEGRHADNSARHD